MCGVAGIFRVDGRITTEDVAAVLRMMDVQIHRGPDDWGILLPAEAHQDSRIRGLLGGFDQAHVRTYQGPSSAPACILGSRRLSIIDLSPRGRMPMSTRDGRVWLTYNGEIYNFRELRNELERRRHTFESNTDTEVVLHGYEEWGEEVLQHLRGMFAFAILDVRSADDPKLFLAKDRFGIKPLYYYQDREKLIFASQVRAIMSTRLAPAEKNVEALFRFLQLGSVPVPMTTIKDIVAVPAGHCIIVDQHDLKSTQYWDFSAHLVQFTETSRSLDFGQVIAFTRELLNEAVNLHLTSDVPLGVFLSGGIDSSSLVALASSFRQKPLTTLSIVFGEPEYSEAHYARVIAKRYQTDHHEALLQCNDFFEELPWIFAAMDQPTVDGVNTYHVSKVAKEVGLTVVLAGTGGDEVFLGYDFFKKAHSFNGAWRLFSRLPILWRKGLIKMAMQGGALARKNGADKLAYLETPAGENVHLLFRGLFAPRQIEELLGVNKREFGELGSMFQSWNASRRQSLLSSFTLQEFRHYLQNQLLRDTDFMSMAHSIETRVPLLDHRLVEYVAALPAWMKLQNGMNKPLLVKALGDDLPREVWDRPKMGFTFPFGKWMKERADDLQTKSLEQTCFEKKAVEWVWKRFRQGHLHWSRPWAILVAAHVKW